jgi:chromosome segregation ATPase
VPRSRAWLLLPVTVALVVTGCGGDDGGASAEDWANDVCVSIGEWVGEVDSAVESLTEGGLALDEAGLREAADRVGGATDELAADLQELDAPEVDDVRQAQMEIRSLLEALRDQYEAAQQALAASLEPLQTVARIATAISTAATELQASLDDLARLDPAGELAGAFRDSEDCDALREQVASIGSG